MIKTNIKMRVTPEQSVKVQEICFENGIRWKYKTIATLYTSIPYLYFYDGEDRIYGTKIKESFISLSLEEIDPELFIRTNGSCIEKREEKMKHNDKMESLKDWQDRTVNPDLATDIDNNKAKNPNSKHYELWENFEAIDVIKLALTDEEYKGFLKGNILKYQLRLGKKDEVSKEIEKIEDYKRELKNEN